MKYFPRQINDSKKPTFAKHGPAKHKLFIFDDQRNDFGYEFSHLYNDVFHCLGCPASEKKNHKVTVKLCQKESGEYYVRMRPNQIHFCEQRKYEPHRLEDKIISLSNFKFYQTKEMQHLVVMCSDDPTRCYDYKLIENRFICHGCKEKSVISSAKVFKDTDNKEFIRLGRVGHVCTPIKFSTIAHFEMLEHSELNLDDPPKTTVKIDESKIIKEADFELRRNKYGTPDSRLIVILPHDRSLCYEYFYRKHPNQFYCCKCRTVFAKFYFDDAGKQYLKAGEKEHTCEPVKYESEKLIIKAPDFIIYNPNSSYFTQKLIIFTSPDHQLCYHYTWITVHKKFYCKACYAVRKKVTAKIQVDEKGAEYIQLSRMNHVCSPIQYIPEKMTSDIQSNLPSSES